MKSNVFKCIKDLVPGVCSISQTTFIAWMQLGLGVQIPENENKVLTCHGHS